MTSQATMPQVAHSDQPPMTPLAPSVEKAYYRKCIQLKRRLNEVEAANDETKLRRLRLDRAIMKMRLERAFLLDELRRRMDQDVDGSDGSGDEGMATPPPDRPHRDKRRRPQTSQPPATSGQASTHTPAVHRTTLDPSAATSMVPGPGGRMVAANAVTEDGEHVYVDPADHTLQDQTPVPSQPLAVAHGSPYAHIPSAETNGMDIDANDAREGRSTSHEAGVTRESEIARPLVMEGSGEKSVATEGSKTEPQDG